MNVNQQIINLTTDISILKEQFNLVLKLVNSSVSSKTLSNFSAVVTSDMSDMTTTLADFELRLTGLEERIIALEARVLV